MAWSYATTDAWGKSAPVLGSPAIGPDGAIYFGTEGGYAYALHADGTKKWRADEAPVRGVPAFDGLGRVGFGNATMGLDVLHTADGSKGGTADTGTMFGGPAVDADGWFFVGDSGVQDLAGTVRGLLPGTPKSEWLHVLDGPVFGSPAIGGDGTLYLAASDGYLYAFAPLP